MRDSYIQYAGVAATFVFSLGMLIVGKTLVGVGALVMSFYWLGVALSSQWSVKALLSAILAVIWSGFLAYQAVSNEFSGKATYWPEFNLEGRSELVTRETAPAKF